MKYLGWAVLAVFAVVVFLKSGTPPKDGRLAIAQATIAELTVSRDAFATQVKELEDSLQRRMRQAHAGQDETRRRVPLDSSRAVLADSLAVAAATMSELRAAYDTLRVAFDSSQRTVSIAQQATNDALAALAFATLTIDAQKERLRKYDEAAPIVLAASKPNWWKHRLVISAGYGATITQSVIRAGPQVSVGVRLWAL